jgi:hypothetical protein
MKYVALFRDEEAAKDNDLDEYTLAVLVEADSREEALEEVTSRPEEQYEHLEFRAMHDGDGLYEVVTNRDELLNAKRRLRLLHNQREQEVADELNARGGDGEGNKVIPDLVEVPDAPKHLRPPEHPQPPRFIVVE